MYKHLITIVFLISSLAGYTQELKSLDLESTVFREFRDFYPERLSGVEWIAPNAFVNVGAKQELLFRNVNGDTTKTIALAEINKGLKALKVDSVRSVRPYAWLDSENFILQCGSNLVRVNTKEVSTTLELRIPKNAENLAFSKSSKNLAYTLENNVFVATPTDSAIQVTNHSKDSEISAGVAIHRYEFGISKGLFWSDDGLTLGFYEMDESMVTDYPLVNYNQVPAEVNLIKYPMAGQKSHHAKTGVFHTATNEVVYLKTGEPLDHYLTNFTFSLNGQRVYLAEVNRDQNEMHLNVYSAKTGDFEKTLFTEKDEKYIEPQVPPYFPKGDSEAFLWMSRRDGNYHLYSYNADGVLLKQITKGDLEVLEINGQTEDGNTIVVTTTAGLMDRALYSVNVKTGKMRSLVAKTGMYHVTMNKGDYFVVRQSSPQIPGKTTVMSAKGKIISTLLNPQNPLDQYEIGAVEFPVLKTDDGTQLQGRLIKPYDFDPSKKYPVIVYVYGGPHLQLITNDFKASAPMWMYEAANRGYIIFSLDNRGSANRGKEFEQAVFRNLGTLEMDDQLKGVDYLKSLPFVNADKMAIHGWSYGGFMATSLMLRHPGVFQVGVAGGPVTDWRFYEIMYCERYMDTPEQNPKGYATADLKNYVEKLEGDLLLIHGLDDDVVVPQHSFSLIEKFVKAGVEVDFFAYPGHAHNVRGKDRVHLMTKVLDYIDLTLNESEQD